MKLRELRFNIFVLTVLFIFPVLTFAQRLTSSADKTTVGENESFRVYFEFQGEDINKAEDFRAPDFEGFRILGGPNQSTSMQIINGKVSGSLTYSFILRATKTGNYTIKPASIVYEGKRYVSKPLFIRVVKGRSTQQNKSATNSGGLTEAEIAKNVFLKAFPSKTKLMQGEQLTVTYKLFTKLNISSPSISKLPVYKGFWAEEIDLPNNISFHIEMYNGERFRVATIKEVALFPTRSGLLEITPFELNVPVMIRKRQKSRSLFDDFFNDPFFGRTETYQFLAKSNSIKVKVEPLPVANVPASFKGAVGEYKLKAYLDKAKTKINEPISLKLQLSGKGNIKLVNMPELNLPAGFEQYDPKVSENITSSGIISGTKSIEYLIVPRIPGKKLLPAIEFSYFSLKEKKYKTLKAGPFSLEVEGSIHNSQYASGSNFSKENVQLLNEDIRYIKTNITLSRITNTRKFPSWFIYVIILSSLLFLALVLWKRQTDKLRGDIKLMRSRKAEKIARKRLSTAKKALDAKSSKVFYEEIAKALQGYLEDKLFIQTSEFTIDRAIDKLTELNISGELSAKVKTIFDKCEFARFAPSADVQAESDLYKQTIETITELENSIKRVK